MSRTPMPNGSGTRTAAAHTAAAWRHAAVATCMATLTAAATTAATYGTTAATMRTCHVMQDGKLTQHDYREMLGRAVDYLQSGKYHEALLLFKKVKARYDLSDRCVAFMGVCAYYDADYALAASLLLPVLPSLSPYAPQEQAVYMYCAAQSLLKTHVYDTAIDLFEQYTTICKPAERTEALVAEAECYMQTGSWEKAEECIESARMYCMRYEKDGASSEKMQKIDRLAATCKAKRP